MVRVHGVPSPVSRRFYEHRRACGHADHTRNDEARLRRRRGRTRARRCRWERREQPRTAEAGPSAPFDVHWPPAQRSRQRRGASWVRTDIVRAVVLIVRPCRADGRPGSERSCPSISRGSTHQIQPVEDPRAGWRRVAERRRIIAQDRTTTPATVALSARATGQQCSQRRRWTLSSQCERRQVPIGHVGATGSALVGEECHVVPERDPWVVAPAGPSATTAGSSLLLLLLAA